MDPDFVRSLFMTPFASVEEAYAAAKEKLGEYAAVTRWRQHGEIGKFSVWRCTI